LKTSTAVIGSGENIVLPKSSKQVDYEGEFGVVISKKAKDVPEEKANDFMLGYFCINDVPEGYFQKNDGQWTRAKGFDPFAPIGPWIVTDISANDLKIETYLNDESRQSSQTSDLLFGVPKLRPPFRGAS
jgi:2-keto-4-pentenoate hydratase/2-oxohepta-3-ene-1,7-dioic acid hydratase in catechol pathway